VDPSRLSNDRQPAGWEGLRYWRLHGAPRIYYSAYETEYLARLAAALQAQAQHGAPVWCIFDNTASGAATADALKLVELLELLLGVRQCSGGLHALVDLLGAPEPLLDQRLAQPGGRLGQLAPGHADGLFSGAGSHSHPGTLGNYLLDHVDPFRRHLGLRRIGADAGRRLADPDAGAAVYRGHVGERSVVLFGLPIHDPGGNRAGAVAFVGLAAVSAPDRAIGDGGGVADLCRFCGERDAQVIPVDGEGLPPGPRNGARPSHCRPRRADRRTDRGEKPPGLFPSGRTHLRHVQAQPPATAGDDVLRQIGRVICESAREGDVCGRLGGEEFALLLANTSIEAAHVIAEQLRQAIADITCRHDEGVTASLGVAAMGKADAD
nr:hypothetical protein [Tanacetum cinerariifolium]